MTPLFMPVDIKDSFDPGAHIVLHQGDCLDFLNSLPARSIQLIVTSPPYNLGKEYEERQKLSEYLEWQKRVITECYRVLKEEGSICWQVGNFVDRQHRAT